MADRAELMERLEALQGPDRDVEEALALTYGGFKTSYEVGMAGNWWHRFTEGGLTTSVPAYTSSIDAALALVEKVLPGWWLHGLGRSPLHGLWWATLYSLEERRAAEVEDQHSAPLAILIVLLRSLEAKEGER